MPDAAVSIEDDYYTILSVPRKVDFLGLQNAYSRLSDDLARRVDTDPTAKVALLRLNQAYGVLSRADSRAAYDAQFFAEEFEEQQQVATRVERRSRLAANALLASLVGIVLVQIAVVGYLARDHFDDIASVVLGPFGVNSAN